MLFQGLHRGHGTGGVILGVIPTCGDITLFFSFKLFIYFSLTLRIFYTPHFPHSAFSTLRIFHTPHFPHSTFSTLRIFYTPHFPHSAVRSPQSAVRTPRFPLNLRFCHFRTTAISVGLDLKL